jgi:hypothetical protein
MKAKELSLILTYFPESGLFKELRRKKQEFFSVVSTPRLAAQSLHSPSRWLVPPVSFD